MVSVIRPMAAVTLFGCAAEPAPLAAPATAPGHEFVPAAIDPVGLYWVARDDTVYRDNCARDERTDIMIDVRESGTVDLCITHDKLDVYDLVGYRGRFEVDGTRLRFDLRRSKGKLCGDEVEGPEISVWCGLGRLDGYGAIACPPFDPASEKLAWALGPEERRVYVPQNALTIRFDHRYENASDHTASDDPRNWKFEWLSH